MRYLSEIFGGLSWYDFTMNLNNSEFFVCLSVCLLAYFLTEMMSIWGFLQFWMIYISAIFWAKIFSFSCMSVSLFVSLLPYWNYINMGISLVLDEISFWIFLETFLGYFCLSASLSVSYISSNWSFLGVNFWDLWSCFSGLSLNLFSITLEVFWWLTIPTFLSRSREPETICVETLTPSATCSPTFQFSIKERDREETKRRVGEKLSDWEPRVWEWQNTSELQGNSKDQKLKPTLAIPPLTPEEQVYISDIGK